MHSSFSHLSTAGACSRRRERGATLVEAIVALGIFAMAFAAIFLTSHTCRSILRNQRETVAANQLLQERIEQLRAGGWSQLTDALTLSQGSYGQSVGHTQYLPFAKERVRISTYPALTPAPTPIEIERRADGTVTILSQPPATFSLRQFLAVRVDLHVDWKSADQSRARSREISTVIALGGLLQ